MESIRVLDDITESLSQPTLPSTLNLGFLSCEIIYVRFNHILFCVLWQIDCPDGLN